MAFALDQFEREPSDQAHGAMPQTPATPALRPRSATAAFTGLAGLLAALGAIVLLQHWLQPPWLKALLVVAATAFAMIAVELGVYRSHRNSSSGLAEAPLRQLDLSRVGQKLVGFWGTLAVIAACYLVIPEYAGAFYAPFKSAALWCLPGLALAAPFYIAWVDRRQSDPVDAYVQIARLLGGRRPESWDLLLAHARAWVVKAFFLPLMFVYLTNSLAAVWAIEALPSLDRFDLIFAHTIDLLYLLDVLIGAIGYGFTLRLLDTEVRSTDDTVFGWVICLICYPPLWTGFVTPYFAYERDQLSWGSVFAPWPLLYVTWGSVILVCVGIYAWSTLAFGLRFSNLTNRGIITNGPYRWTKHPAYISKCISFWMISVPFVAGAGWAVALQSCLLLAAGNLIYVLRARTEERHLLRDPAYRDYSAYIAQHGVFARLRRLARRSPFTR